MAEFTLSVPQKYVEVIQEIAAELGITPQQWLRDQLKPTLDTEMSARMERELGPISQMVSRFHELTSEDQATIKALLNAPE